MVQVADPVLTAAGVRALRATSAPRRALFLDRDGVINVNHGYVHSPERTDWVPGIFDFAREAADADYAVFVVTNQAGIARGYYTVEQFMDYTHWQHARFGEAGVPVLATYYCPHHPEVGPDGKGVDCACRKPRPGMLLAAIQAFGLDAGASLMLGDMRSDAEAAAAAGVGRFIMVDGRVPSFRSVVSA